MEGGCSLHGITSGAAFTPLRSVHWVWVYGLVAPQHFAALRALCFAL